MSTTKIYKKIKNILENARLSAYRTVNFIMVQAYWNIGKLIVEEEQKGKARAEYGKYLIEELSKRLTEDFKKGFDKSNLWYMRLFYILFPILDAVRRELSWTHYRLLIRIKKQNIREFYINECIENN